MEIRKSTTADFEAIRALYEQARMYFANNGINQWQKGYPEDEIIRADIAANISYVGILDHKIVATFVAEIGLDPSYESIFDGWWRLDERYIAIHRIAVDNACKGRGIASDLIAYVQDNLLDSKLRYIKADTHIDNLPMQRLLEKNGFKRVGVIKLAVGSDRGARRVAYDKIIK